MTGEQASRAGVSSTGVPVPGVVSPGIERAKRAEAEPAFDAVPGRWSLRRAVGFAVPAVWALGVLVLELQLPVGTHCVALLAATPALACAGTGARIGAWLGGAFALVALYPMGSVHVYEKLGSRFGMCAAIVCVAMASCYTVRRRARLTDELARTREVATAAQQALIRPLPQRIGGYTVAAGYLSAARGAAVGGDLYDAVATAYGVRVVIGDVRGHGLGAVGTVSAVLGCFREAAYDEARLERVPHRLQRALDRHLAARLHVAAGAADAADGRDGEQAHAAAPQPDPVNEEFLTALLLEMRADGTVTAVNCGHPWPYRLSTDQGGRCRVRLVSTAEPLPPLGMLPLPPEGPEPRTLRLPPGDALFLYTDGAEDARDAEGGFFPLTEALTAAVAVRGRRTGRPAHTRAGTVAHPADVVDSVRRALQRHAGGRLPDDVALLAVRNDRCRVHGQTHRPRHERAEEQAPLACSCP